MKNLIYLINALNTNQYKIGITDDNNLEKRIKNIQTGSSHELMLLKRFRSKYATVIERKLHNLYKEKKSHGEWFTLDDEDILTFESQCLWFEQLFDSMIDSNNPFILKRFGKKDL